MKTELERYKLWFAAGVLFFTAALAMFQQPTAFFTLLPLSLPGVYGLIQPLEEPRGGGELSWRFEVYSLAGCFCLLVSLSTYFVGGGRFGYFWIILFGLFSFSLLFSFWRLGLLIFLLTGSTAVFFSLKLSLISMATFGLGLYLCLYLFTALWRLESDLRTTAFEGHEINRYLQFSAVFGLIIWLPLLIINFYSTDLIYRYAGAEFEPAMGDAGSFSFTRMLIGVAVLVVGLFVILVLIYLLKKFFKDSGEELKQQLEMPESRTEVAREEKSDFRSRQAVMRGGMSGEVISAVHDFLDYADRQGLERDQGETVRDYLSRLCKKYELNVQFNLVASYYNSARYSRRTLDESGVQKAKKILGRLKAVLAE